MGNLSIMCNIDRENKTKVSFTLSRDKWQRFQGKCREQSVSDSEILNLLVDIYLGEKIEDYKTLFLLDFETEMNQVIGKYIRNKLDNYIDRYIEQKLLKEIKEVETDLGEVITKDFTSLENIEHHDKLQTENYDYQSSSMIALLNQEEIRNNNLSNNDQELKTARELAEILHCSPAYITTLNRLGDLEKRGWRDSGQRHGKAILYQRINF